MLDSTTKSTVYMRNSNELVPLTVTPVLYLSNGRRIALPQLVVEPGLTATISLGDALQALNIAPYAPLTGYVALEYTSSYDPVCATVVSVDAVHSTVFTYGFRPTSPVPMTQAALLHKPPPEDANTVRQVQGVWWKHHQGVRGFVSLSNFSDADVQANLVTTGAAGKQIATYPVIIPAHNTQVVDLPELKLPGEASGGVDLTYTGAKDSLLVSGALEDAATGYSAEMTMHLHSAKASATKVSTFSELDLMTGAADPMMLFPARTVFTPYSVVRNVRADPAVLTPELFWMQAGAMHRKLLSAMTVAPGASTQLDIKSVMSQASMSDFNGSFNLTLQTSSLPESLLLASGSIDQTGTYVFQIEPHLVNESVAKSVSYWSTANGNNTMMAIWNPADEPQDYSLTLHFKGGQYTVPVHLDSRATYSLDLASLIQNQVPDASGAVIPLTVTEGSAKLTGIHAENEAILGDISAGTFNVKKATCSGYCQICDGYINAAVASEAFDMEIFGQYTISVQTNTGVPYVLPSSEVTNWSSNNTNIAIIASYTGLATGVNYGSTYMEGSTAPEPVYTGQCEYPGSCPQMKRWQAAAGHSFTTTSLLLQGCSQPTGTRA